MAKGDANEEFFDAMIRHQIGLLRLSGRIRNEILEILDATEKDIRDQITRRYKRGMSTARLEALIKTIRQIRSDAWKEAAAKWREELLDLARAEPQFIASALQTVASVQLDLIIPSAEVLRSIVTTRPFEGRVLKDWAANIRRADLERLEAQIRIGMTQGETSRQIAARLVGTVRQRGRNGVTEITRRNAEAITRTAVNAISNQAKRELYKANADILEQEIYVATLDSRTTPICRSLDGNTYKIGEGPIPPLHFNCRSLRVATINGEAIGTRPMKAVTERQLLREYSATNGIRKVSRRADLPRGHKGAFDQFARKRIRELTGQVDADVNYGDWLRRQSHQFQDDVLGPTRARLFRKGGLTLDRFVDQKGRQYTLAELAQRDRQAFIDAGFDLEEF